MGREFIDCVKMSIETDNVYRHRRVTSVFGKCAAIVIYLAERNVDSLWTCTNYIMKEVIAF
jgi:hypothetical protein